MIEATRNFQLSDMDADHLPEFPEPLHRPTDPGRWRTILAVSATVLLLLPVAGIAMHLRPL